MVTHAVRFVQYGTSKRRMLWFRGALAIALVIGLTGGVSLIERYSPPSRLEAGPSGQVLKAEIEGMPGVRYIEGQDPATFRADFEERIENERHFRNAAPNDTLPPSHLLALSGGGDDGAFGAGFLCGWSERQGSEGMHRPDFALVTGISTGALIAPFAFLGPNYDDKLKEVYTTNSPEHIFRERDILAVLFNDAMADNTPLSDLMTRIVNKEMLDHIAQEHRKGRGLLILTTNLDARRAVIWNMGKIAAYGGAKALELFRKILMASAAVPGMFPPVMIDVVVDGKHYQEMHVDGAATSQVFLYPAMFSLKKTPRTRTLYVIRNGRLDPEYSEVERRTLPITKKAIFSLIHNQGIGDLHRIYHFTQENELTFKLAFIPREFSEPRIRDFDTAYMKKLFQTGHDAALNGHGWHEEPPVTVGG